MQCLLDLAPNGSGKLVKYIGRLMHPAALVTHLRVCFTQCLPKAQDAIANGQSWCMGKRKPLRFYPQQEFQPALLRFPIPVLNSNEPFSPLLCHTDNYQDALFGVVTPDIEIHAINPYITNRFPLKNLQIQASYSCSQMALRRLIVEEDTPFSTLPRRACNAPWKSPVEIPLS